ncbi:hypothetical protein ACLKA6_006120 [Drosophila palustris]
MNILQPLLLDRSCLVNKMKKLSPLIDQLEWINTNDRAFRAYWSFYANGCKQRQQDIRQRIEQNADFVKNIKSKKAASFLKILTQDKAPIKVTQMEASDTIYQEFLECFRRPRKRDKNSQFWWQREFDDALKRLNRTRNPYDMVQIIEKLKKIKQLQRRSTYQRIPEPKPLIIADLIADFVKSRSIEKIFKDMHPAMFNPPPQETKKPKEPKPIKINQPKGPTKKRKRLTAKPQLKPKACISCSICQQLQKHPSNALHPYMLQMQSQLKRNELRAYYKQMMLRNCQLARELQAQRHPKQHFCHVSVMS